MRLAPDQPLYRGGRGGPHPDTPSHARTVFEADLAADARLGAARRVLVDRPGRSIVPKKERLREPLAALPTLEHLNERISSGWKLVALEWEREASSAGIEPEEWSEEIPFGLQVSDDCRQLVENPAELQMVVIALDMIVEDCPLSQVADELN